MNKCVKTIVLISILLIKSLSAINSGQFFILTLPTIEKHKDLGTWLEKTKPAGVMLMPAHVKNKNQTKKLCNFLQTKAKQLGIYPLLICIDWEGGIISRPTESGGFVSIPSPRNLAKAGIQSCFLAGQLIGQQMRSVGINVDFAPSLDLFDAKNIVLATRCFSDTPEIVAECGVAISNGLLSQNAIPVIKHYPGLMLGKADTHFNAVEINTSKKEFELNEKPFIMVLQQNRTQENIPMIMVSHAQYTQFGSTPASMSANVIAHLKKQNPNLIVITDDIAMQAYHNGQDLVTAALESINNGFKLLIYSAKPEEQIELISKLNELIEPETESNAVRTLKQKIETYTQPTTNLNEKQVATELAQRALAQKIKFVNLNNKNIILVTVNLPKIRPAESWFINDNGSFFANLLSNSSFDPEEYILDAKQKTSISTLQKYIASGEFDSADYILVQTFFFGDGIWNETQNQWLNLLKLYQDKIIILSLGHPYEKFILSPAQIIELGSFHKPILTAAFNRLTNPTLLTGADKLALNPEKFLVNKNIGLLCHKCSVINLYDSDGNKKTEFLPDFLYRWARRSNSNTKLCALFAPEHGILGSKEAFANINSEESSEWGCPVYSLHGATKSPTTEMLKDLDLLIIDFQEVGVRCYTYLSTLALTIQAAKDNAVSILILERPNPIKFLGACGPNLNPKFESFLGKVNTKFIHGSTIGDIAKKLNKHIGADLTVLACGTANQQAATPEQIDTYFLNHYIPPSPNLPTIDSIYAYPMTVFIEGTNYSEGRGTPHPFEQIGAPWVDAKKLAANLNKKKLPGIYFEPISFTPKIIPGKAENPKQKDKLCHGIFLHIQNRKKLKPIETSQAILSELFKSYPKQSILLKYSNRYAIDSLEGDDSIRKIITAG